MRRRSGQRPGGHGAGTWASAALEALERRVLWSGDPAVLAYQARAEQVLSASVQAARAWASAQASLPAESASISGISEWTVAAVYARSAADATLLPIAHKAAAALMSRRVSDLFTGGNDGWPAWATADLFLRYRSLIEADPTRYQPAGFAANAASPDGKYTLAELFRHVLTQSTYAPIDSTSNHVLMNATARYLAEQAFPGQVVKPYNNSTSDPTGANTLLTRARQLVTGGPAEYLSLNYGVYNWAEFLSVQQLTTLPGNATLVSASRVAYEAALAMNATYWMNGQLAGPVGRGYPDTGAWGASGGDALTWVYLGGDFGQGSRQLANASSSDVKALGVLAAVAGIGGTHAGAPAAYVPPAAILSLDEGAFPTVTRSNYGTNKQYAYNTGTWSTYSESFKNDAFGPYQASWRARTIWTRPSHHDYNPVAWVTNPATSLTAQPDGRWTYVDPYTLQAWDLSGSGTYGGSAVFSDMTQHLVTVLRVYNIPPLAIAGTPGGLLPVRGSLIYLPIPIVAATGLPAQAGDGWMPPVLSSDSRRLFVAYESVFMVFASSAPISPGSRVGSKQFFNIHGGDVAGQQADPDVYLQYAVAQETFSPSDFAGTTLAERFANFQAALGGRELPRMIKPHTHHPVWQYADERVTITNEFVGDEDYNKDPQLHTRGFGHDTIGGLGNTNPRRIDYASWPLLEQTDRDGRVLVEATAAGNLALTLPGHDPRYYDFTNWRTHGGSDIDLVASSRAGGQIALAWRAGLAATHFSVERSSDGLTWSTLANALPGNATTYTDTGLSQRGYYLYRVTPHGTALGTSLPAGTSAAFNPPSQLRFTLNGTSGITLNWSNSAAGHSGIELQYSLDGYDQWRWLVNLPTSFTSRSVTYGDLVGGERIFYRALAWGTALDGSRLYSPPSNVVGTEFASAYVGGTTSMPRFLTASASGTAVQLGWIDTATNETAYQVERSIDGVTWTLRAGALPANSTTFTDTAVAAGTSYRYRVAPRNGSALGAFSNVAIASTAPANAAPLVTWPAAAMIVSRTAATLSVRGADDAGEADLDYLWSVTAGPGSATFSTNHGNAARTTDATFSRAGTYTLTATIRDAQGLVTRSSVDVVVEQVMSSVRVTPPATAVVAGGNAPLAATALDQFGQAMKTQPPIAWSTTAGSISAGGLFTAPAGNGAAVVSATLAGQLGAATVAWDVVPPATALYRLDEPAGSSVAQDASGNALHASRDAGVTVGVGRFDGAAVFAGAGTITIGSPPALDISGPITLAAWVRPGSASGNQTLVGRSWSTSPRAETVLRINGTRYEVGSWNGTSFIASGGNVTADVGTWVHLAGVYDGTAWRLYRNGVQIASVTSGVGAMLSNVPWRIGSSGSGGRHFSGGLDEVRLVNAALPPAAIATLASASPPPTIAVPATLGAMNRNQASLSVLGASVLGESTLGYTWQVLGTPPAAVTFSRNGTNAARQTLPTFAAPGTYHLAVTVADASGRAATSVVVVYVRRWQSAVEHEPPVLFSSRPALPLKPLFATVPPLLDLADDTRPLGLPAAR
jgi:hypothetical protein